MRTCADFTMPKLCDTYSLSLEAIVQTPNR